MPTTRTPRRRGGKMQITPKALAAFREMQRLEQQCACEPIDWSHRSARARCTACDAWWAQHSVLVAELALRPWQWPAVENPDAACPYPAGSVAAEKSEPDREAQARYRALARAAAA